jgi:hypothetical protein
MEEKWPEEAQHIQGEIWRALRIAEWQQVYTNASSMLPGKAQSDVGSVCTPKFDALSNRAFYSREPLQRFWNNTLEQLKGIRLWNVDPGKLTSLIKELFLTTSLSSPFAPARRRSKLPKERSRI